jgi:hypothetical protein
VVSSVNVAIAVGDDDPHNVVIVVDVVELVVDADLLLLQLWNDLAMTTKQAMTKTRRNKICSMITESFQKQ